MINQTRKLCEENTALSTSDIDIIVKTAASMELFADLSQSYYFIDCLSKDNDHAIVVAEAFADTEDSLYSKSIIGKDVFEIFEPGVFYSFRNKEKSIIKHAINQEGKSVHQTVIPIYNTSSEIIGVLIQEKPIQSEESELLNGEYYSVPAQVLDIIMPYENASLPIVSDLLMEMFILTDQNHRLRYANPVALKFLREMSQSNRVKNKDLTKINSLFEEVYEKNKEDVYVFERIIENRSLIIKKIKLKHTKKDINTLLIIQDLTELKMKEKELSMKSILIEEVHHRVKNNLQTIASLLRLQMHQEPSKVSQSFFEVALNRIYSISAVYEIILSNSESTSEFVNVIELVKKVSSNLVLDSVYEKINLIIETNQLIVLTNQKKAVSLSLIINELTQNILKHAFHRQKEGDIHIAFTMENEQIKIHVVDNGIGIESYRPSLGLEIVRNLIESDLEGNFEFLPTKKGTHALITFHINSEVVVHNESYSHS